jgi:hypothetical protein
MFPLMVLTLAIALLVPADARAQQVAVEVHVLDAESGAPLAGAQVRLSGSGVVGVTDDGGKLLLREPGQGGREVEASYLGYSRASVSLLLPREGTVRVTLPLERRPIELEPVDVKVLQSAVLARNGFFRRRDGGHGTFFTREEIAEMRPRYLSDVLRRAAGMSLTPTRTGARASVRGARAGCGIQYYLDGVLAPFFDVDQVQPENVEGLEIYRGAATIPPGFNRGTAMCGAILIWTRAK